MSNPLLISIFIALWAKPSAARIQPRAYITLTQDPAMLVTRVILLIPTAIFLLATLAVVLRHARTKGLGNQPGIMAFYSLSFTQLFLLLVYVLARFSQPVASFFLRMTDISFVGTLLLFLAHHQKVCNVPYGPSTTEKVFTYILMGSATLVTLAVLIISVVKRTLTTEGVGIALAQVYPDFYLILSCLPLLYARRLRVMITSAGDSKPGKPNVVCPILAGAVCQ